MGLPRSPILYEINAWVWLGELSRKHGAPLTLATVPDSEWDAVTSLGAHALWLMGVWERSPAGRSISLALPNLRANYDRALPGWEDDDVPGSPYCVRRYRVDDRLGGPGGLAAARAALEARGLGLVLDFVPNHVAPDHPWIDEHPEYLVGASPGDLERAAELFLLTPAGAFAYGRDPFFPPWTDTVQLNAFHPGLRAAAASTLRDIAAQCDGVRCDMAMLLSNDVFARTWGAQVGRPPGNEYWQEVIPAVRASHPDFVFIAEAYWDLEWALQRLGFDYCYDKRLYDRLAHGDAQAVRLHQRAEPAYQERLLRFIENHDEPRAAATFVPAQARAAAVVATTVPGARLLHQGQLEGARVKLPVQLGRRPGEPVDVELRAFYRQLLAEVSDLLYQDGEWAPCEPTGWPDNPSHRNLVAWCWRLGAEWRLVVVNLADAPAQARVALPWSELGGRSWLLSDALSGERYRRSGDEMLAPGLYVELPPWGVHLLRFG
jgi:glycosidase